MKAACAIGGSIGVTPARPKGFNRANQARAAPYGGPSQLGSVSQRQTAEQTCGRGSVKACLTALARRHSSEQWKSMALCVGTKSFEHCSHRRGIVRGHGMGSRPELLRPLIESTDCECSADRPLLRFAHVTCHDLQGWVRQCLPNRKCAAALDGEKSIRV